MITNTHLNFMRHSPSSVDDVCRKNGNIEKIMASTALGDL
jgi:hypothetical protein